MTSTGKGFPWGQVEEPGAGVKFLLTAAGSLEQETHPAAAQLYVAVEITRWQ